ncbi:hypothetical protein [Lysobacter sp. A378]
MLVPTVLVSDFRAMWIAAEKLAATDFTGVATVYEQRVALLLVPALKIFGSELWVLHALNTALAIAIWALCYDAIRIWSGHYPAQIMSAILVCAPELMMSLMIPTHDLWGCFFLAVWFWAAARSLRRMDDCASNLRVLGWSLFVGVCAAFLQVQREFGYFAIGSIGVVLAARAGWNPKAAKFKLPALSLLCVVLAFSASSMFIKRADLVEPVAGAGINGSDFRMTYRLGSFTPSYSTGKYAYGKAYLETFIKGNDAAASLSRSIVVSDLADNPDGRAAGVLHKLRILARIGSQSYFYAAERGPEVRRTLMFWSALYAVMLSVLALLAVLQFFSVSTLPAPALLITLFTGSVIGALALVAEVQSRYIFFIWLSLSVIIGYGASLRLEGGHSIRHLGRSGFGVFALWVGIFALYFGLSALVSVGYATRDGRIITEWSHPDGRDAGVEVGEKLSFLKQAGYDRDVGLGGAAFTMEIPGSGENSRVDTIACDYGDASFGFHYAIRSLAPRAEVPIRMRVLVDNIVVWTGETPSGESGLVNAPIVASTGCHRLAIVLDAPLASTAVTEDGLIEIYYPRLIFD